ncbi:MAG: Uroporphyrinogen-III synthase [Xanthomonadales bacterium]|nr:Uroporphyrinogen-III synthase [Xanthomonadales bacterium]
MPLPQLVLLTRPRRETRATARFLAQHGVECLRMPLQTTRRAPPSARLAADLAWAAQAECLVFVSRAAVAAAARLMPEAIAAAPARVAVGAAAARGLLALGLDCLQTSEGHEDSEGVLDLPALREVRGQRIGIFAAPGGRTRIAATLAARGAQVRTLLVYRRVPQRPCPRTIRALRASADRIVLGASSGLLLEALERLLVRERLTALRERPLIVASARIGECARALGYADVRVARGASVQAWLEALEAVRAATSHALRCTGGDDPLPSRQTNS